MKHYDVVIIGAGTAGLSAQKEVAELTDNYLVVDSGPLGTTCARVGCMPSKVLIEAATIFHQRTKFTSIGVSPCDTSRLDGAALMKHVRALRDRFVAGVMKDMARWRDTHLRAASARFLGAGELEVGGDRVSAKKIIVATGSEPMVPASWRGAGAALLTTDEFFELEDLPANLAVVGAGAIGLELSQALARLGVNVSLFGEAGVIGGLRDPSLLAYAGPYFAKELKLVPGRVDEVKAHAEGAELLVGKRSYVAEKVLVAVGRAPRVRDLDLGVLGLPLDKRGLPPLDYDTFRVTGTNIFFAGDVNTFRPILHEASDQGRTVGKAPSANAAENPRRRARLAITFTSPQIAIVGQGFGELTEAGEDFVAGEVRFDGQGRALAKLENVGMIRVYARRTCGKVLGAELFCPAGEHMAHLLNWAIDSGCTVFDLLRRPFYHPTLEEGLRTALRDLSRKVEIVPDPWSELHTMDPPAGTYCP